MIRDIRKVGFGYNDRRIFEDVELTVQKGELLAILGPNGVGKTTLLKCINAIHRPDVGSILVEDRNILQMSAGEIALAVGYVAQESERANLTVFDAVLMGRKPHIGWRTTDRDLQLVDAALTRLDLNRMRLCYIDELSGGELQMVAICRALVQVPKLLLLDEPTSSLDMRNQAQILTIIRHIVDEHQISAVMTMHDLNSALRYADRYCFIKGGEIHAICDRSGVTAEMIEEVYGLPVSIHYVHGNPIIIPETTVAEVRS